MENRSDGPHTTGYGSGLNLPCPSCASLRARAEKAEAGLCRAREVYEKFLKRVEPKYTKTEMGTIIDNFDEMLNQIRNPMALYDMEKALSSPSPCAHAEKLAASEARCKELEEELKEGDYWMQRADDFQSNGGCPCCYCTDEGPHKNGCYIGELEDRLYELGKINASRGLK